MSAPQRLRLRLLAALLTLPPPLWCRQARAGDTVIAEELFREGKELMRAHDYARACPKLAESFHQDAATGTLLALAMCQEEAGLLASAWAAYKDVVARAHQEGRSDRESAARIRAATLEPRLSTLQVDVGPAVAGLPGLVVSRDGAVLAPAAWGSPLPTDPGTHLVEARADGRAPRRQTVVLGGNADRRTVLIASLAPEQAVTDQIQSPEVGPATSPSPAPGRAYRIAGLVSAGLGVVGVGVGTAFAIHATDLDQQSNTYCDGSGCNATGHNLNQRALTNGDRATTLFIAGGALLAGGAALYLVGRRHAPAVEVSPLAAAGFGGAALVGKF